MKVKDAKKLLESCPDEAELVVSGSDHSYKRATAIKTTALFNDKYRQITEDHGEDLTPEKEYGERRVVVLVLQ